MGKWLLAVVALALVVALSGCASDAVSTGPTTGVQQGTGSAEMTAPEVSAVPGTTAVPSTVTVEYDNDDLEPGGSGPDATTIALGGDSITIAGAGVLVDGTVATISSAGTYVVSGTLDDGQIVVDTEDDGKVILVLGGVDITSLTSAPIYVVSAGKTLITLADGTMNYVSDSDAHTLADPESDEPNAAIFSHDDLTINGTGSLTVDALSNNGITSKDDLKITGGTIIVNAVNDGIKGRDSIAIRDGTITVNAGGDGLQSNNDEGDAEGYIVIEGGVLSITAGLDGIQAQTDLLISDGAITVASGGGSGNSSDRGDWGTWGQGDGTGDGANSAKGLKAGADLTIENGLISIDSSDDAVHSNGSLSISGGNITLSSGDDGIHSNATLVISGGAISITKSYEGIESAAITIGGGTIRLVSSDDGINTAGGADGSALGGRPGQNAFGASDDYSLTINGGYIAIDALGDGIDANGLIEMTDGIVLINGPTGDMNGALDYMGSFTITGGLLVAVGSAGMAEAPSELSSQYSVMVGLPLPMAAGVLFHMQTEDGEDVLTFVPTKMYQNVVVSSPDLESGGTYVVYTGGSSTGAVTDSLVSGGAHSGGTEVVSFTVADIVTSVGSVRGGAPGGMPGRPGRRP